MINPKFLKYCDELEKNIQDAYEAEITMQDAEKLAAKFLGAMMQVNKFLRPAVLDSKMRKSGLKAICSAVRVAEIQKHDKKPTEGALDDAVNLEEVVQKEREAQDVAEADTEMLKNYMDIFKEAHVYFRGIAKGAQNG